MKETFKIEIGTEQDGCEDITEGDIVVINEKELLVKETGTIGEVDRYVRLEDNTELCFA